MPFHDANKRWRVIVAHRRAGKTVATVNHLIRSALLCPLPEPRVAYIAPLYKQAKDVAWTYLKRFSAVIPGVDANESELRVDLPNRGRVRLYGADNPDGMRGIYLDDVVLDEYADMRPRVLPEIIRPALSDRKGSLTAIGTPRGHNDFYKLWQTAQHDPEWFGLMLRASETGLVDAQELADASKFMSPEQYAQEFECFKPDALVMCHDQAKPIADIRIGDVVLTHTGRFRRVTSIMSKRYAGEMVRISAWGSTPIVCTPEHPIRVCDPATQTFAWKGAKDVTENDWLVTPRMETGGGIVPADLAEVIAWFVCEGTVSGNSLTFSIGAHEPEYVARLRSALSRMGHESTEARRGNVAVVSVNSVVLCDFLLGACGSQAHNKRLPMALLRGHEQ
ncbi:MAG: hypothetical protein AB7G35_23050, partial [Hyphomicrobiaceae bacterium]